MLSTLTERFIYFPQALTQVHDNDQLTTLKSQFLYKRHIILPVPSCVYIQCYHITSNIVIYCKVTHIT